MNDPVEAIAEMARRMTEARHERLETFCEAALQSGHYGVLVINDDDIRLSDEVPYGEIHYYPHGKDDEHA